MHIDTVAALGNSWQNSNLGHLVDHQLGKTRTGKNLGFGTPPGIKVITTESHGPQFFHWFRNMESILSQTKLGRLIYEAARWFKHRTIATYNQWERTYREAVKELGLEKGYDTKQCPHCGKLLWLDWSGKRLLEAKL